MMLKFTLGILYFFCWIGLIAQDFEFENISTKDGLSQNDVNCIIQDKQGFMWFGTNDGLNLFDGYEFEIFRYNANSGKGLNSNLIQTLAEDKNHNIWIGTSDGGVNVIQSLNQEILNISVHEKQRSLLEKESIFGIDIIDGIAVVLTKETIFFFKVLENGYQPIKVNNKFFIETGSTITNCYLRVSKNEFIIGTKHGLKFFRFNNEKELQVNITDHEKKINVISIVPFRNGYLTIFKDSIYYINENLKTEPVLPGQFNCLLVEDDNRVWVGDNFGLHHLTFENDSSKRIVKRENYTKQNTNGGLGSNFVKTIYKDKHGLIWLGTIGGGLSKLVKRNKKFKLFRNKLERTNLEEKIITCIFEDSDHNLWLGTDRRGILYYSSGIYDYNTTSKEIYDSEKAMDGILAFHEISISNEPYVIASTNNHIITSTNRYYDIRIYNTNAQLVTNMLICNALQKITHPVNVMVSDEKYLWLGTREGGLFRYNYCNDELIRFLTHESPTLCSNLINSLFIDSKKNLWIGTDKGLNVLIQEERNKRNPTFKKFTHSLDDTKSINYNNVVTILEHDNTIWLGTLGGGLSKYNLRKNTFSHITTKDGLASNNIKGILNDNNNQLWISSNNGLSCLNLLNNKIINFGVSSGLQDYEFRKMAYGKRKNGELFFGGNNGFNSFFPEQIETDTIMPNLVFTRLNVVSPSSRQEKIFNRKQLANFTESSDIVRFKYNESSFTAYFSALHYIAPLELEYKYRLVGFEKVWTNSPSQSRFAKYTNLHPGKYTLEVLATNGDGVWMNKPLQLNIYISKAWYKNNVAYTVYLLLLLSVFTFFTRFSIIRNKIKHNLLMERFEKEKEKQLSQLKLRFFTNVSHELRTPITIIKSYFENLAPNWQDLPAEKLNRDFLVINRNVNSLNRLVCQLLEFRKLEQDKMTLVPEMHDMVKLISVCTNSFNLVANNKKIDLSFYHECEELEFWFDEDKMEIIINNIISNALKYTPEGGKITVRLTELEEEIEIEVEDNGIGIPQNIQNNIFERFYQAKPIADSTGSTGIGLSLTKGLIELHKGRIELKSSVGEGSNFLLFFKKGNSHFNDYNLPEAKPKEKTIIIESHNEEILHLHKQMPTQEYKERTVLIVEDNEDLRLFLVEKLQEFFKVDAAVNGKSGLEKCIENTPDIVLSDIMMPEMNGYELCDALKNNETISHIPVILLTAKANIESELRGFKLGADAYVGKPFNLDVLIARIIAILNSRQKIWQRIGENPFFKPSEVTFTAKDEQFLYKITTIIEKYMPNPDFSVEQLAEHYDISKMNLNNKIKALTGKTSVQFIRLIRIRKAAQLLKAKHNRISEVTYDVGYSDLQHFRIHFKKEFSLTPSEYQKKYSTE